MLYRKINSCLLYNSQTNMLNKILRHLSSKGRVWVLCYFNPFTVLIFPMHSNLSHGFSFEPL